MRLFTGLYRYSFTCENHTCFLEKISRHCATYIAKRRRGFLATLRREMYSRGTAWGARAPQVLTQFLSVDPGMRPTCGPSHDWTTERRSGSARFAVAPTFLAAVFLEIARGRRKPPYHRRACHRHRHPPHPPPPVSPDLLRTVCENVHRPPPADYIFRPRTMREVSRSGAECSSSTQGERFRCGVAEYAENIRAGPS